LQGRQLALPLPVVKYAKLGLLSQPERYRA
jgi:hypothetical protein